VIPRSLTANLSRYLGRPEVLILYGARQVGKSTLLSSLAKEFSLNIVNCEKPAIQRVLQSKDINSIRRMVDDHSILALDEAQKVEDIGPILKLLYDDPAFKHKIIATGSSSFVLSNKINEPLTGRNLKLQLFPLTLFELQNHFGTQWTYEHLNQLLIYGSYPAIVTSDQNFKVDLLQNIAGDYLFQDILLFENVRNPRILLRLLQALALQIGSEVSLPELGSTLGLTAPTVQRYLDLLEHTFVIFSLPAFSRNLRNELKKSRKYYFYDLGIRNALLNNFSPLELRSDVGGLWENFCVSERKKMAAHAGKKINTYFWRTYDQAEIDLVEEVDGRLSIFEFKFNPKKRIKFPKSFLDTYSVSTSSVIHRDNFLELISAR